MIYDRAMGPDLHLRHAIAEDAPHLEHLYRELVPGDDAISVSPQRLVDLTEDAHNLLLVAAQDSVVVGSAFLTLCPDPMYGFQPYGLVENVVVAPTMRSTRIGDAMMMALRDVGLVTGCSKLMLLSNSQRARAHAFFRRCGFDGDAKRGFVLYRRDFASGRTPPLMPPEPPAGTSA